MQKQKKQYGIILSLKVGQGHWQPIPTKTLIMSTSMSDI